MKTGEKVIFTYYEYFQKYHYVICIGYYVGNFSHRMAGFNSAIIEKIEQLEGHKIKGWNGDGLIANDYVSKASNTYFIVDYSLVTTIDISDLI